MIPLIDLCGVKPSEAELNKIKADAGVAHAEGLGGEMGLVIAEALEAGCNKPAGHREWDHWMSTEFRGAEIGLMWGAPSD